MTVCRRIDPHFPSCRKLNHIWIKDLNIRPDILNLIEDNVGNRFVCTGTEEDFLNRTIAEVIITLMGPHGTEKLLYGKGYHHLEKVAVYRLGNDFYQLHF